jgi:hypothetical protein
MTLFPVAILRRSVFIFCETLQTEIFGLLPLNTGDFAPQFGSLVIGAPQSVFIFGTSHFNNTLKFSNFHIHF